MKKIAPNREFVLRHLFSACVFVALGLWFAADAFVRYPSAPAAALYESIEKSPPPGDMGPEALEAFKAQKVSTQKIMAGVTLLAGAAVLLHLLRAVLARFEYDADGFASGGVRCRWSDADGVDLSRWESKRIAKFRAGGRAIALDGWHHTGVDGAVEALRAAAKRKEEA